MHFSRVLLTTIVAALSLSGLLLSGCSKHSTEPESATPKSVTLGIVEMSYNTPARKDLGDDAVCAFTAAPLDANTFELTAVLEKAGKKVASTRVIPATADQPLDISFGNVRISFVPHIK
jgi:hypothetical protein